MKEWLTVNGFRLKVKKRMSRLVPCAVCLEPKP